MVNCFEIPSRISILFDRSDAFYSYQYWPIKKDKERHLAVIEAKMLRYDHVRDEDIAEKLPIGVVIRADKNSLVKIGLSIEVNGKRLKGWPKQRWLNTLNGDLRAFRLHRGQASQQNGATDQDDADPTVNGSKAEEKDTKQKPVHRLETR